MQRLGFFLATITSAYAWYCPTVGSQDGCLYDGCNGYCWNVWPPGGLNCWIGGDLCPAPPCIIKLGYYCSDERGVDPQPCPPGQYQPWAKNWWSWAPCQSCPPGTYSSGWGSGSCTQCADGSYTPYWQSTSCLTCPTGSACALGAAGPTVCPRGTFSLTGSGVCSPCAAGSFVSSVGSTQCFDCPAGYECGTGSPAPSICSAGFYSGTKAHSCVQCPYKTFSPNSGSTSCLDCPDHQYVGSSDDNSYCLCDAGFFAV